MKVLYLTPGVYDKGGISRYNRYQIQALKDILGPDQVKVISLLGPSHTAADLEIPFDVDWHGSSPAAGNPASWLAFVDACLRICRSFQPDVVWTAHINFSAFGWFLSRLQRAIGVVQVYGLEVWTPRPRRPDIFWGFRRANAVVSDCHFTARFVEEQFRLQKRPEVMWDCVDTRRYYPANPDPSVIARYGIPAAGEPFNVLTLGRISADAEYKGYARLLEVFPCLPAQARLIYGGSGDLTPALRRRAAELGVSDRVVFTGFIDERDLPDIYRSASVFSLVGDCGPGRGEGIPLTPLEAAACGVPILVGNQDGSAEAVRQGENGYALDPFDLDLLAEYLQRLAADGGLRKRLGQAARLRIEMEHSYPVFRERVQAFCARLG